MPLVLLGTACGCGAVLLGFAFVAQSDLITARFGSIVEQDVRPHLWQAGASAFALNPVVGTGAGTYLVYGREFRHPSIQTDPVYTHDDYIQLLAEYGPTAKFPLTESLDAGLENPMPTFCAWTVPANSKVDRMAPTPACAIFIVLLT